MDLLEEKLQENGLVDIIDDYTNNNLYDKEVDGYTIKQLETRIKDKTGIDINDIDNLHPYAKFLYMFVIYMYYFRHEYREEQEDLYESDYVPYIKMAFTTDKGQKIYLKFAPIMPYEEPEYEIDIEQFEDVDEIEDFDPSNYLGDDEDDDEIDYWFFYNAEDDEYERIIEYIASVNHELNKYNFTSCEFTYNYSLKIWRDTLVYLYDEDDELNFEDDPSYLYPGAKEKNNPYNYFYDENQKGFVEMVEKYYTGVIERFSNHIAAYCDKSIKLDFIWRVDGA